MSVFPLLASIENYRACEADLLVDADACGHWIDLFESHFEVLLAAAASDGTDDASCDLARAKFGTDLDLLRRRPDRHGRLDILLLDQLRREALTAGGIVDAFRLIKIRENQASLAALNARLTELDAQQGDSLIESLIRGILAGNLFDMGAKESAGRFADQTVPFDEMLATVQERPWLRDELDQVAGRLLERDHPLPAKVIIFVDNAGADIVLGVLPLARHLLHADAEVILAANTLPSLNDVTCNELRGLTEQAAAIDQIFASPKLSVIDSGCISPLIDLTLISPDLADAALGCDLVILIGMGRAIESNYSATFTCDCIRIASLKNQSIARSLGGKIYDAVVRFDVAS